jgi:uncharacterized caspase-like protein
MTTGTIPTGLRALAALAVFAALCLFAPATPADTRVALLIGNNAYPTSPLRNAVNDSRDLASVLRELGFKTIAKENTTRAEMIAALQEFGRALDGADAALFFYAGHAMQFRDRNYLIPVDATMNSEDDVTFFSVEVAQVFDRMERAKTRFNFVILDACRDNPFRDSFKVSASGLAQMSGPSGTLIAYATAPGATAADGFGRNGIYTGHILRNIKVPDMPVELLFRKVREGVERDTKRLQTPWELSSIKGDFAFNPTGRAAATAAAATGPSADITAQFELQFWKSVQDSTQAADIQAYLDKYPNGVFAALARNRIDALLGRLVTPPPPDKAAAEKAAADKATAEKAAAEKATAEKAAAEKAAAEKAAAARAAADKAAAEKAAAQVVADRKPEPEKTAARTAAGGNAARSSVPAAPPTETAPTKESGDATAGREIAPGKHQITYADGSVYVGAMRGLRQHGKGQYTSKAFRYEGEFQDGAKQGQGKAEWESGDRYEGSFAADHPDGRGRFQFANGDSYEGEVKAGVIAGRGTYVTRAGDRIEGNFSAGLANGIGICRFASGDRYEGEFAAGKPHGKGRYFAKGGDRIEAPFVDGRAQGKGTYEFANGDRYEGDLHQGALTGAGTYVYAAGQKYEGEMREGVPQGRGTFWFANGSRFEGVFENGLAKAKGALVRPDGTKSVAEIVDGAVRLP